MKTMHIKLVFVFGNWYIVIFLTESDTKCAHGKLLQKKKKELTEKNKKQRRTIFIVQWNFIKLLWEEGNKQNGSLGCFLLPTVSSAWKTTTNLK